MIRRFLVGALLVGTISGVAVGPRVMKHFADSKANIARMTVRKLAHEAFPTWASAHPDQRCPARLADLGVSTNSRLHDPWGGDYQMFCGDGGIVVQSFGQDGVNGTRDDVWSNL